MNKLILTKETSAIFLAIVLVTGTFALSYPLSLMTTVQAQPYFDYGGMDNRHDSYKPTTEYPSEYKDRNSDYNSYEPKVKNYGNDNSYSKSYGKDSYKSQYQSYKPDYKPQYPSYGKDSYKSQYQSYKPDYKPQYPSYGKDNRDKSKDSSKSVDIKKINCINTNININGNNTGDINLGNKGQVAEEGYPGAYSSGGSGYSSGEGYYDGNYKKDKGITCIINNNNTNTNIQAGGGNVTDGNVTETTCEECFAQVLNATELARLQVALGSGINVTITVGTPQIEINSLEELCDVLENLTGVQLVSVVGQILRAAGITLTSAEFFELITCIGRALDIAISPTRGLTTFDINTGGPASSFSPPTTIAQETGDSSALEKIAKLKQQWLNLLP